MPKHRTPTAPRSGEDYYDLDHYCRTVRGDDADYRTKTRGGDSVGCGSKEVEPLSQVTRIENNGDADAEIVRLDFSSRYLSDKP